MKIDPNTVYYNVRRALARAKAWPVMSPSQVYERTKAARAELGELRYVSAQCVAYIMIHVEGDEWPPITPAEYAENGFPLIRHGLAEVIQAVQGGVDTP